MAADSNNSRGFEQQQAYLSFQSGAVGTSSTQMILMNDYYSRHLGDVNFGMDYSGVGVGGGGMLFPGNLMNNLSTTSGLKHDTGLAAEWTLEEQYKLDQALIKFASEPCILKYIKIASVLRDKTVRDVALRCRWMTRKRRKQEDYSLVKKLKDRKEKSAEISPRSSTSAPFMSLAPYSLSMNHHDRTDFLPSGALLGTRRLLEENNQTLNEISANLSKFKIQDNVDLFFQTKNNLTTILNDMRNMPGFMSQMPPLPVFLNEELVSSLLHSSTQPMIFSRRSEIQLKQEPAC